MKYAPPKGFVVLVNGERLDGAITAIDGDMRWVEMHDVDGKTYRVFGRVELVDQKSGAVIRREEC